MKKTNIIGIVLFCIPMVLILSLTLGRKKAPASFYHLDGPHPNVPMAKNKLLDKWSANTFSNLDSTNIGQMVGQIKIIAEKPVEDQKKQALQDSVTALVSYFNSGTYADYAKFRFVAAKCALSDEMSNFCQAKLSIPVEEITNSPRNAMEKYWGAMIKNKFVGFWVGLSLDNCNINLTVQTNFDNRMFEHSIVPLQQMTKTLPNVGILLIPGGAIRYKPTAKEVIAEHKSVEVATVTLLPKTGHDDIIYPVYVTLYWSPDDKNWLPYQIAGGYSGGYRKRTLWF